MFEIVMLTILAIAVLVLLVLFFLLALTLARAVMQIRKMGKEECVEGASYLQCHVKCDSCGSEYDLIGSATGSNQCPKCGKHIVLMGERK